MKYLSNDIKFSRLIYFKFDVVNIIHPQFLVYRQCILKNKKFEKNVFFVLFYTLITRVDKMSLFLLKK